METKIKKYFLEEKKVTEQVAKILCKSLLKYEDIAEEFCYWIENREYMKEDNLVINGYSATDISKLASHLDASGVYGFMVSLRDNPVKAEEIIKNNFPNK